MSTYEYGRYLQGHINQNPTKKIANNYIALSKNCMAIDKNYRNYICLKNDGKEQGSILIDKLEGEECEKKGKEKSKSKTGNNNKNNKKNRKELFIETEFLEQQK